MLGLFFGGQKFQSAFGNQYGNIGAHSLRFDNGTQLSQIIRIFSCQFQDDVPHADTGAIGWCWWCRAAK